MDFTLDEEQSALRDAVREMLGRSPASDAVGPPEHDAKRWQQLAEMGLLGLVVDPDAGPIAAMLVAEELGRARVRAPYADVVLATSLLAATSSPTDSGLLDDVVDGSAVVVTAFAEPGRGWSAPPTVTAADGALTGVKDPVDYADAATHALVLAAGGVHLVESPPVAGSGFAFDATPATLVTDDPAAIASAVGLATVTLCGEALGAMEAALDLTVAYLKSRKQFGVPLMAFEALTHRAVDCYVSLELARSTVLYAAMALADDQTDLAVVSRTKVVVGKAGRHIGQEAIQLHGGIGMTAEYAVGHLTSRLTAIEHTMGDTRHHLLTLAARLDDHETVDVL